MRLASEHESRSELAGLPGRRADDQRREKCHERDEPDDPCIHIERHGKRRVSRQHQDQHRVKAIRDCNRCNCAERRQHAFSVTS